MSRPALAWELVQSSDVGILSTHSVKCPGSPFGSLMLYAADSSGRPVFLISSMALHTKNLTENPNVSLLVATSYSAQDALAAARATLIGTVALVPKEDAAAARKLYLQTHPAAELWVEFADFRFFRMEVSDVYYVGGFGEMGWVTGAEYGRGA